MIASGPADGRAPRRVCLVAIPDASLSTLIGIYDVLKVADQVPGLNSNPPGPAPFQLAIVGESAGPLVLASGLPVPVQHDVDAVADTDIIVVPSILLAPDGWPKGRYPRLVRWLAEMHRKGAVLCSACSGMFLLAETGLYEGVPVTVHFDYARAFASTYPGVPVSPERVLMVAGPRESLVSSGAAMAWHDLVLYLISRYCGSGRARAVARFFALQWHQDGLAPYIVFEGRTDHGDAEIAAAQRWLAENYPIANPVEEMIRRSKLAERTFKRRFVAATGIAPIGYTQRLRIEEAKRRLEETTSPVDDIGWRVGYEDPAFFRRLFKRTTGVTPGAFRRQFRVPDYASLEGRAQPASRR